MAKTRNFAEVIRAKLRKNPELAEAVARHAYDADVGQKVHDARVKAGLSQKDLAAKIGTHQSVISRIEDADYGRPSMRTLERIAEALDLDLRVVFKPKFAPTYSETSVVGVDWEVPATFRVTRSASFRYFGEVFSAVSEMVTTTHPDGDRFGRLDLNYARS